MDYETKITELVDRQYRQVRSEMVRRAIMIQSEVLRASSDFLRQKGFVQILPVIVSPVTDPLRHATGRAEVEYYEHTYQLTKSMIFHKQISLLSHDRIFAFSPNVRLEAMERADTGRHLFEFSQLDLEVKEAKREEVMNLAEDLLVYTLTQVKQNCADTLEFFNRDLIIPHKPFKRIAYQEAYDQYVGDFEVIISQQHTEPVWIVDMGIEAREFYDREYPDRPGYLVDMDLLYPEGFGEALSGGEREHSYESIIRRIEGMDAKPEDFQLYLEFARRGLPASAGFGIGLERLTRFISGLKRIQDAALFPKVPGRLSL